MKKIILVLLVLAISLITACSGGNGIKGETPEQAVTNLVEALKTMDKDMANRYLNYDDLMNYNNNQTTSNDKTAKMFISNLSCNIVSSNIDKDNATVNAEIVNTDLKAAFSEFLNQALVISFENAFKPEGEKLSEDDLNKKIVDLLGSIIEENKDNKITTTMDIKLIRNENSWKINMDRELQNAILGGLVDAADMAEKKAEDTPPESNEQPKSVKKDLEDIVDYVNENIENDGFNNIKNYISGDKNTTSEAIDIDVTMKNLDEYIEKKKTYDTYINDLDQNLYANVKTAWDNLSKEIDKLYTQIKEKAPTSGDTNYDFNTDTFSKFKTEFVDEVDKIKE